MDDSAVAPTSGQTPPPANSTASSASDKNPLDVLEEILNESKARKGSSSAGSVGGAGSDSPSPSPEEQAAAEEVAEAAKLEQIKQQDQLQRQQDQSAIEQRLEDIRNLKNSPQYQARLEQQEEAAEEQHEMTEQLDGTEIIQLQHKTVDMPDN